jgi:glycosyltransferase involved in cell wall biosynthesis
MNVLFVTSAYPTHRDDARGIFIHRLARGLIYEGIRVTVVVPGAPGAADREQIDGVEIHRVQYWFKKNQRLTADLSGIIPNLKQHPWLLAQVPSLVTAMILRVIQLAASYDVIHAHWLYPAGIAGVMASKIKKIPLVLTSHGGDLNLARRSRGLTFLAKQLSLASNKCVGVSQDLCKQFTSFGVPCSNIAWIPYGVDEIGTTNISRNLKSVQLEAFVNLEPPRLLYLGSLNYRKSVETLLDAYCDLERSGYSPACAIVGSGPAKDKLIGMALENSSSRIRFFDPVSPLEVPAWMAAAHMLILPSLSEGRPVVVLEAMAMGVPVVATDIPGTRELVRNGKTGFLFVPGDSKQLAGCIEKLINDEALRVQMGQSAKQYVATDGLTTQQIARRHINLYEQALVRDLRGVSR